jgi:heptosyltransferase-2
VLLIGSAAESALTGAVREAMRERAWDLAGALDVGTLKALVRQLSLLVCNDAGARHIAVAFGVPCLVFFGPTSLAKTNVNLENVHILEIDVACRPCYLRECPIDHPCMREIRPDSVISLACEVLGAAPGNARPPAVVEEPT